MITHKAGKYTFVVDTDPTLGDDLLVATIAKRLATTFPEDEVGWFEVFGRMVATTKSGENLPFDPAQVKQDASDINILRSAYLALLNMPRHAAVEWLEALGKAQEAYDAAFAPVKPTDPN